MFSAVVRSARDVTAWVWRAVATGAQSPCAAASAVLADRLSRMRLVTVPWNAGECCRSARFWRSGKPELADHWAMLPKPAPRAMMAEAQKARWTGASAECRDGIARILVARRGKRAGPWGGLHV